MGYEEEIIASPFIEMHFIELPKFRRKNPGLDTKLDQWLWFLSGKEEMIEMAEKENREIKKAVDTLDRISLDPKEREVYESIVQAEFNQKVSNQKFLEEGIAEGEKKKGLEVAKKLLKKDIDVNIIAEVTGISESEIEKLIETE